MSKNYKTIKLTSKLLITEAFLIICFFSVVVYWIRGIHFNVNLLSFYKLLVLLLIITPQVLLISPSGIDYLKKMSAGHYNFQKICLYIIITSLAYYSITLQKVILLDTINWTKFVQFIISLVIYTFAVTWKPIILTILLGSLLSFKKTNVLILNWQIALIFVMYFLLKEMCYLNYKTIGESAIRMELGKGLNWILFMPESIIFFSSPGLFNFFYIETWIHPLTIGLLVPKILCLKDIGIGNPVMKIKKIFIKSPIIWIYFLAIVIKMLFFDRSNFPSPIHIINSFYSIFLTAFFEEICFRGVLQTCFFNMFKKLNLKIWLASFLAILIASILFSLVHYPFSRKNMSFIFLFGLLTGRIFYKTNSLIPGLMIHTTINILAQMP
jgi:membrane protease YdiL (CAAX protease family)